MLGERLYYSKMANPEVFIYDMKEKRKEKSLLISDYTKSNDSDYLALDEV